MAGVPVRAGTGWCVVDLTWEGVESFIGGRTVRSDAPVLNDFLRQQPVRRLVDVTVRTLC